MWIEHLSKSFGSIKTAVFYGKSKKLFPYDCLSDESYPGDLKNTLRNDIVQHRKNNSVTIIGTSTHGFVENNLDDEFLKYNFQKMTSDSEFKEFRKIDNLGGSTKYLMGDSILDVSKIENCMFPTAYVGAPVSRDGSYFKSARVDNKVVYFIEVPEGCGTIELYDSSAEETTTDYQYASLVLGTKPEFEPAIVIRLGAPLNCINNSTGMYYDHDPRIFLTDSSSNLYPEEAYTYTRDYTLEEAEYQKLQDETNSSGLLIVVLGNSEEKSINLSYASWINDSEPQRQQKLTTLRNQEYYGNIYKKDPTYINGGNIIDRVSGNILGISQVKNTPILNKKLERVKRKTGTERYSPTKEYFIGDKVIYSGKVWISCYNNNISNFPQSSNKWVLESSVTESLNDIIRISTVDKFGKSKENYTELSNRVLSVYAKEIKDGDTKDILIKCDIDFEVDPENIYYIVNREKIKLVPGSDFNYNDTTGVLSLNLSGENIEGLLGNTLFVGVRGIANKRASFRVSYRGVEYTLSKWKEKYGEDSIIIKKGETVLDTFEGLSITNGDTFEITAGENYKKTYFVESAEVLYGDTRAFAKTGEYEQGGLEKIENGELRINTSAAHTIYLINITQNLCKVEIIGGEDYEVDEWYKEVPQGTSFVLKIYPVEGSGKTDWILKIKNGAIQSETGTEDGIKTYSINVPDGMTSMTLEII